MNNKELIDLLNQRILQGEISRDDVISALKDEKGETGDNGWSFSITKVLYVLGAVIVILGLIIFVQELWDDIGSWGRVGVTLGLGLLMAMIGSGLMKKMPKEQLGTVFHLIGGILVPTGSLVALYELGTKTTSIWPVTWAIFMVFVFYLFLAWNHRHWVLSFFSIVNGTAFLYLLVGSLEESRLIFIDDLYVYLTMILGVTYIFMAKAFKDGFNNALVGVLLFVGSASIYIAGFDRLVDSGMWQFLYLLILMAGIYLSIEMKSRSVLFVVTVALLGYVGFITSKYFADSLGWSVSLVLLGFAFIGLGYGSIQINRKFIKEK